MTGSNLLFFVAGAVVAIVAGIITHHFDTKKTAMTGSHVLLSPEDYIEIQQLYGMYPRDVDPGAVVDASWMFTNDAVAVMDTYKTFRTPEEIKAFYQDVKNQQSAGIRHFNSSYVIVGTPDGGARGSSYMMEVQRKTEGGNPEVTLFGKYEDKFVKTPEGWRIKERVFKVDTFRGDTRPITASPVPGNRQTDTTGPEAAAAP
jgi:hypothetical protein